MSHIGGFIVIIIIFYYAKCAEPLVLLLRAMADIYVAMASFVGAKDALEAVT